MFNQSVGYFETWNKINYNHDGAAFAKLAMRSLIREIHDQMLAKPTSRRKFVLHSGHDTTVLPLLAALGGTAFDGHWPHYAHMVVFELYTNEKESADRRDQGLATHFRILSNGKPVQMTGCSADVCPLPVFRKYVDVDLSDAAIGGCTLSPEDRLQAASTATVPLPLALSGAFICSAFR